MEEDSLEEIESCAEDDPFDTVLVTLAEGLPDRLLLWRLSRDGDPCATAVRTGRVLLYLSEFDALWRDVVAGIGKVEHAPESSVRVRFGDLEEGEVWRVWGRERELVDGRDDACVRDGPFEVARGFAADDSCAGRRVRVTWVGRCGLARDIGVWARREELGDAEVALGRGRQKIVLGILCSGDQTLQDIDSEYENIQSLCGDTSRGCSRVDLEKDEQGQ